MVDYINSLISAGKPFSFFLVDVDNFKTVNDTYGHAIGDKALIATANFLSDIIGEKGIVGRYGGDEFMFVIEDLAEYKDIWAVGHALTSNMDHLKLDELPGLRLTITIGISRFPTDASDFEKVLNLADKALYRGKLKGRNCFIIYLPEKHGTLNIQEERESKRSNVYLCYMVYQQLTATEDLPGNIAKLFKRAAIYFMFDHICIEHEEGTKFHIIHALAKNKEFSHIPLEEIKSVTDSYGLSAINKVHNLNVNIHGPITTSLKSQRVSSAVFCKISAYGEDFGYVRVDMTDTYRMWQSEEIELVAIIANTLGIILHYQKKSIKDLQDIPAEIVGS
jgi:diguanylate cyclase (GGDEF)-like protein